MYTLPYYYFGSTLSEEALLVGLPDLKEGEMLVYEPYEADYSFDYKGQIIIPTKTEMNILEAKKAYSFECLTNNSFSVFYINEGMFDQYVSYGFFQHVRNEGKDSTLTSDMTVNVRDRTDSSSGSYYKIEIVQEKEGYVAASGYSVGECISFDFQDLTVSGTTSDSGGDTLFLSPDMFKNFLLRNNKVYDKPSYGLLLSKTGYENIKEEEGLIVESPLSEIQGKTNQDVLDLAFYCLLGVGTLFLTAFLLFFYMVSKKLGLQIWRLKYIGFNRSQISFLTKGRHAISVFLAFLCSALLICVGPLICNGLLFDLVYKGRYLSVIGASSLYAVISLPVEYVFLTFWPFLLIAAIAALALVLIGFGNGKGGRA